MDPGAKDTWPDYDYHRGDANHTDIIYFNIPKLRRNDAKQRGARFDWSAKKWYGDVVWFMALTCMSCVRFMQVWRHHRTRLHEAAGGKVRANDAAAPPPMGRHTTGD